MTLYSNRGDHPGFLPWMSDTDQAMIAEFAAAIREERTPGMTGLDGYKALEVVIDAYRSVELGEPVSLDEAFDRQAIFSQESVT